MWIRLIALGLGFIVVALHAAVGIALLVENQGHDVQAVTTQLEATRADLNTAQQQRDSALAKLATVDAVLTTEASALEHQFKLGFATCETQASCEVREKPQCTRTAGRNPSISVGGCLKDACAGRWSVAKLVDTAIVASMRNVAGPVSELDTDAEAENPLTELTTYVTEYCR